MAHRGTPFEKVLSAGDRNDRFSVPASWRDQLLPQAPENGTASVRVLDDKGDWYNFVLKVRKNKTKPEFMAKGWKRFVRNRKLFPGDVIVEICGLMFDQVYVFPLIESINLLFSVLVFRKSTISSGEVFFHCSSSWHVNA